MRSKYPRETGGLSADTEVVRIAALIAASFATVYLLAGLVAEDQMLVQRSIGPWILAGIAGWKLIRARTRPDLFLVACAVFVVVQVGVFDSPDVRIAASFGLVMIGAVALILSKARRLLLLASYSLLLFSANLWWHWNEVPAAASLSRAVVPAFTFLFLSRLLLWAKNNLIEREARYWHLFDQVPAAIYQEDYSRVGQWLDELRNRGVADLRSYLTDHPDEARAAASTIIIKEANTAALELLEVEDKSQLLGPLHIESFTEDTLHSKMEQFVAIWEKRYHLEMEVQGCTLKGAPIDAVIRWFVPVEKGVPNLANVVIAWVDVTELHRTKRQLQDLVKSKDQFIASVSHELRTPLTAVIGLAEELRTNYDAFDRTENQEFVELIADQAADVANIVEDLLVASRADIGTVSISPATIDVRDEVESLVVSHSNGSRISSHLPDNGQILAVGDPTRVRQILRNLLSNAHRYGGSNVELRAGADGKAIWIEVADDGAGIPPDQRERIFEPYQTAHQLSGLTAAVGLGLTVSRQLARLMAGDLTYRHDNRQSIFRLTLPRAEN